MVPGVPPGGEPGSAPTRRRLRARQDSDGARCPTRRRAWISPTRRRLRARQDSDGARCLTRRRAWISPTRRRLRARQDSGGARCLTRRRAWIRPARGRRRLRLSDGDQDRNWTRRETLQGYGVIRGRDRDCVDQPLSEVGQSISGLIADVDSLESPRIVLEREVIAHQDSELECHQYTSWWRPRPA